MTKGLIGISGKKKAVVKINTLWTKTEVSILAYFVKNNNKPSTYREITRAYISASYSSYQKACEELVKRGYLIRDSKNLFKVREATFPQIQRGTETIEIPLPSFNIFLKKVKHVIRMKGDKDIKNVKSQ